MSGVIARFVSRITVREHEPTERSQRDALAILQADARLFRGLPWRQFSHPEGVRSLSRLPRFAHELPDQTTLATGSVAGGVKDRLVRLLMMAALQLTARLLSLLPAGGGVDDARPFVAYLGGYAGVRGGPGFQAAFRRHGSERGDELMTYAEERLARGPGRGSEGR